MVVADREDLQKGKHKAGKWGVWNGGREKSRKFGGPEGGVGGVGVEVGEAGGGGRGAAGGVGVWVWVEMCG